MDYEIIEKNDIESQTFLFIRNKLAVGGRQEVILEEGFAFEAESGHGNNS
ncbi:MAG TPA: hypothetical protein PL180_04360 [Spirochaetota bacterium]|nr:hypothetical protein [Spirochaetota bacterium]